MYVYFFSDAYNVASFNYFPVNSILYSIELSNLSMGFNFYILICYSITLELIRFGRVAQLGEHSPYKAGVTGSSPVPPTIYPSGQFKE